MSTAGGGNCEQDIVIPVLSQNFVHPIFTIHHAQMIVYHLLKVIHLRFLNEFFSVRAKQACY